MQHPAHPDRSPFRIGNGGTHADLLTRVQLRLTLDGQRLHRGRKIFRSAAGPELGHDVDRSERGAVRQKHAVPSRGSLHLEAPGEDVRTKGETRSADHAALVAPPVKRCLLGARRLARRAPVVLWDLPHAKRPELGEDVGFGRAPCEVALGRRRCSAVGVDAVNVDRRAALLHAVDAPAAELGGDGHGRVQWVELFHHGGDVVDRRPDGRVIALAKALHLVADAPEEDRRMIFVTEHGLAGPFELFAHLGFVIIVEPVALVAEPDAYRDRKAESVCGVEPLVDVICAPCPHRVCARRRQLLERALAAGATDEIRLTSTKAAANPAPSGGARPGWPSLRRPRATAPGRRMTKRARACLRSAETYAHPVFFSPAAMPFTVAKRAS